MWCHLQGRKLLQWRALLRGQPFQPCQGIVQILWNVDFGWRLLNDIVGQLGDDLLRICASFDCLGGCSGDQGLYSFFAFRVLKQFIQPGVLQRFIRLATRFRSRHALGRDFVHFACRLIVGRFRIHHGRFLRCLFRTHFTEPILSLTLTFGFSCLFGKLVKPGQLRLAALCMLECCATCGRFSRNFVKPGESVFHIVRHLLQQLRVSRLLGQYFGCGLDRAFRQRRELLQRRALLCGQSLQPGQRLVQIFWGLCFSDGGRFILSARLDRGLSFHLCFAGCFRYIYSSRYICPRSDLWLRLPLFIFGSGPTHRRPLLNRRAFPGCYLVQPTQILLRQLLCRQLVKRYLVGGEFIGNFGLGDIHFGSDRVRSRLLQPLRKISRKRFTFHLLLKIAHTFRLFKPIKGRSIVYFVQPFKQPIWKLTFRQLAYLTLCSACTGAEIAQFCQPIQFVCRHVGLRAPRGFGGACWSMSAFQWLFDRPLLSGKLLWFVPKFVSRTHWFFLPFDLILFRSKFRCNLPRGRYRLFGRNRTLGLLLRLPEPITNVDIPCFTRY